jgi:type II secretory pathway component HofQ
VCVVLSALVLLGACARGEDKAATARPPTGPNAGSVGTEQIDLDLTDVDLIEAVRTVAMSARVNVFADPDISGRVSISVRSRRWDEVLAQIAKDHGLRVEPLDVRGSERKSLWITKESSPPAPRTEFRGEPIEVSFDETPVREAARTLASFAKTSIVVDDDVGTGVTLRLRSVPWDLALYHLAQKYELRIVPGDSEIRISRR